MIHKLKLTNFKNFQSAELALGPFSILIGENASGKSNLRDAFRFLHGIGRGYSLADIMGGKYIGGSLQWEGIRGGITEISFQELPNFCLEIVFDLNGEQKSRTGTYQIKVETAKSPALAVRSLREQQSLKSFPMPVGALVSQESLKIGDEFVFQTHLEYMESHNIRVSVYRSGKADQVIDLVAASSQPVITQLEEKLRMNGASDAQQVIQTLRETLSVFSAMRFFSLEPAAMRIPSLPGQIVLGDRGENMSTVIQAISDDPQRFLALMEWIKELTPMDAVDFEFPVYADGKTLLTLVEKNGQKVSANSASDGTLRFLACLAALLSPDASAFYFFEELENGIHPTRLHLLVDLIERNVKRKHIQVVATTHSPQLLRLISPASLDTAALVYRLEDQPCGRIQGIANLPDGAREVIQTKDVARLHESAWFENVMSFLEGDAEE